MSAVVFVAGARPNFMKIAPILRELAASGCSTEVVDTGQHYDAQLSAVFFDQLAIPPAVAKLGVGSGSHADQTARIMAAFDQYLASRSTPAGVVVVGDVNSTLAAALVAAKRGIPLAHVEAGLRSFDRTMPEEINRIVTDSIADLYFVTEPSARANLLREGIPAERIHDSGNVMIDSLVAMLPAARAANAPRGRAIVTLHRPSNVDSATRLAAVLELMRHVAARIPVVFPVHPRTDARLRELGLRDSLAAAVELTAPLGYREFVALLEGARLVLTDSGGVQEETTYLKIPCITLRTTTERPVTVSHGTNELVGDDLHQATRTIDRILDGHVKPTSPIPGWDGHAAARIAAVLIEAWRLPVR